MTTSLEEIIKLKNYCKYQEALDSVKKLLEEEELEEDLKFNAEKLQIIILGTMGQSNEALELCNNLLTHLNKTGNKSQTAAILLIKSEIFLDMGQNSRKFDDYHKTIEKVEKLIEDEIKTDSCEYNELMGYLFFLKGYYNSTIDKKTEALIFLKKSLEFRKSFGDKDQICLTLDAISLECFWLGEIDEGIEYAEKALKILEEYDNPSIKIGVLYSLSNLNTTKGNYKLALDFRHKCTELAKELNLEYRVQSSNIGEAWLQINIGNWEKAQNLASEALEYFKERENSWWLFMAYNFLSYAQFCFGKTKDALENAYESLKYAKKLERKNLEAMATERIARCYRSLGEINKALEFRHKGIELFEFLKTAMYEALVLSDIIDIYLERNEQSLAEEYLEMFIQIDDKTDSKPVHNRRLMSEALVYMRSSDPRERGKAELLFEQLIDNKEIEYEVKVYSLFNLCVLLLTEFQLSGDTKILDKLNKNLERLLKIAEKKNLYHLIIEVHILQSKIASINMEIQEAQELLKKAQRITEENKLDALSTKILGEQELLKKQLNAWREMMKQDAPVQERIKDVRIDESINSMKKQISTEVFVGNGKDPASMSKIFSLTI